MASSTSCETVNYLEDFLVNNGPKQDCLVHICKYINVFDMMNLSDTSKHSELFIEFFNERVVDSNSFDFTKLPPDPKDTESFKEVFEHFGAHMQKIKISLTGITFKNFMQNMVQYCLPGNLTVLDIETKLQITDNFKNIIDIELLNRAQPILQCLKKLTLTNTRCRLDKIFRYFRRDLPNLKSLTLRRFDFYDGWTRVFPNALSNINELRLINVTLNERLSNFELFLNKFTNLQVFVHFCQRDENLQSKVIADCLHRHFPQLKGFGCNFDVEPPCLINNQFNFLEKFTNLTEIHVARRNTVEDLHKIIQFVPNIRVFSMYDVKFIHRPPVAIRLIIQSIKKIINQRRDRCPRNDRVHIIVNEWQYREFKAIKNISNFIKLSVEPNSFDDPKI